MVQTTKVRYGFDPTFPQNWPCQWRILVQSEATTKKNLRTSIQKRNRLIGKMKSSRCLQLARALVNTALTQLNLGDKLYLLVERD